MIYDFEIDSIQYFFDGKSLKLFKDFIPEDAGEAKVMHKKPDVLNKVDFIIANACNGKCVYCYQQGGTFGRASALMDKASADKSLLYIFENYNSIGTVSFFGGEATLNFEIIKYIVDKLEGKLPVDNYEIVTNASIMDDDMIAFCVEHSFSIVISIDGPDYIHNKLRLNCPFDQVISTIKKIEETSIKDKLSLNCTYTKFHLEHIELKELVDFFENMGIKYHLTDVMTDIDWLKLPEPESKIIQIKKFIDKSYERIYANSLNRDLSSYATAVIRALVQHTYHEKFCYDLSGGYLEVFDYNGDRYPCVGLLNKCSYDDPRIEEKNAKNNQFCNTCWAKGLCTNCIVDNIINNTDAPYLKENCYKKELYAYALEKLIMIFQKKPENFQTIIDNYYTNY